MLAPPDGFALKVAVPPIHIGPLLVGAATGIGLTDTIVVYMVAGLQPAAPPLLTVKRSGCSNCWSCGRILVGSS